MLLSADLLIRQSLARGEFNDLPGRGKPLVHEDLSMVPAEHRLAFRILKNAGVCPPEVSALNDLALLRKSIANTTDPKIKETLQAQFYSMESRIRQRLEQFRHP